MTSETERLLKLIGEAAKVEIVAGNYRGLDGLRVLVDFNEGRVPAHTWTDYRPELNEPVWVAVINGVAYMVGPTVPKPPQGTVVSTGGGFAVVTTDIGDVTAIHPAGATYNPGDIVRLIWSGGPFIVSVLSVAPVTPEVPPPPGGGGGRQTVTFTAIDSGSYQNWWRTNDVWSSENNIGAWFYGTKMTDTIPNTATVVAAEIYLPLLKVLGAAPFGRHDASFKPASGPVSIIDTVTLSARSGWVPIPVAYLEWMKVNPGGFGFGLGGYNIWAGTQRDGQSGAIRVTYES